MTIKQYLCYNYSLAIHLFYLKNLCSLKTKDWGEKVSYKVEKFGDYRERRNYASSKNRAELSNLLEIQLDSYKKFLETGIKEVFDDIFPVESFSGSLSLEFGDYSLFNVDNSTDTSEWSIP